MTVRNYIDNAPTTTVVGAITNTATTFTLTSAAGYPTSFPFTATLGLGTVSAEVISVTNITGSVVTAVRNFDGQGAFAHPDGETFDHTAVALDYREANAHVNATTGVHGLGVGSAPVGTTDTQTLTNKTLTAPALSAPVVTSGATVTGTLAVTGGVTATTSVSAPAVSGTTVTGVLEPTVFTNEAARDAAITSPTVGMIVFLTSPTGVSDDAGLYVYEATGWKFQGVPGDTGWVSLTVDGTGWTSLGAKARQIGNIVYLRGAVSNSTFSSVTLTTAITALPSGIAAPGAGVCVFPIPQLSSAIRYCQVNNTGSIQFAVENTTASSAAFELNGIFWIVD